MHRRHPAAMTKMEGRKDGRYGLNILARSFRAFITVTIKVMIKNIKQSNSIFLDYFETAHEAVFKKIIIPFYTETTLHGND